MPWHVEHGGGTCNASEWAVIKDSDGSTAGCHSTKDAAQAQVAALYANDPGGGMNDSGLTEVQELRAAMAKQQPDLRPAGSARMVPFPSRFVVRMTEWKGEERYHIRGVASSYEQPYEMYDIFGPYKETVAAGAGEVSLAASPDVAFLVNHKGVTMARTTNESLLLAEST